MHFGAQRWPGFFSTTVQGWLQTQLKGQHCELFLAVLWRQWRWRNETMMGDKRWTVGHVCDEAKRDLEEYERWLGGGVVVPHAVLHNKSWEPPPVGFIFLMVDGSYNPTLDRMGMGELARDSSGTWLGDFMQGQLVGPRRIICGMDCLDVVLAIDKQGVDFHRYGSLLIEIQLLSRSWEIKIGYVPREGNAPTDYLAGMGARSQGPVVELDSPPVEMLPLLQKDLVAL